ncbi:MAG: type II toxin-antitoxin system RelE/ParE family toxin [Alphaproteobacteria bacterium]
MLLLKNKSFEKNLKSNNLNDAYIKELLKNIFALRSLSLGSKMYKIRAAKSGKGKSGGFRNIFFWKKNKLIIFCLLFSKNEQTSISNDEKKALKILSNEYDKLTDSQIKTLIKNKTFMEINNDK